MAEGRFTNPVVASLAGFKDIFTRQERESRLKDSDRADGKTVLVTGANSGLGFAITVEMARRGARVIMACRSQIPQAGERARKESGSNLIEMRKVDLSKIGSIHQLVEGLKSEGITIDILFLNAATTLPRARRSESGQDEMFLVNYLSNVILTNLLLVNNVIVPSSGGADPLSRIIFISSDSHQGSTGVDYDEFGRYFDYGVSKAISNYSYFKLLLNTYATELSRRINREGLAVSVNAICPGPVASNIAKEAPWLLRITLKAIFRVIFRSPAKAVKPVVYMAISPDWEGTTNEYMHMFNPRKMDPKVYIPEEGTRLWDESIKLWKSIDRECRTI